MVDSISELIKNNYNATANTPNIKQIWYQGRSWNEDHFKD